MSRSTGTGFTLIELMVVVVIIAILAAVGYPSYQDHIRKGKRTEGKTALLKTAQVLERWYSDRNTYATTAVAALRCFGLAATATVYSGENAADNKSAYTVAAATATLGCPLAACFLVTATPNAPHTDPQCGNLTITSTGVRCWSTSGVSAMTCSPNPANASTCKW